MSKYTTELRFICETEAGETESQGGNKVGEIIDKSWKKIFNFTFPIFDEAYRETLCKKILMHYYTQEIGLETYGLWKLKLNTKLNEIMPYYNKLYESEKLKFDVFNDVDITVIEERISDNTGTTTNTGISTSTTTGNGTEKNLYSATPQSALTGIDNETYLTDARKITNEATNQNESDQTTEIITSGNNNDTITRHETGKRNARSYTDLLLEYRKSLLNIDMQVIYDLQELFMGVW